MFIQFSLGTKVYVINTDEVSHIEGNEATSLGQRSYTIIFMNNGNSIEVPVQPSYIIKQLGKTQTNA